MWGSLPSPAAVSRVGCALPRTLRTSSLGGPGAVSSSSLLLGKWWLKESCRAPSGCGRRWNVFRAGMGVECSVCGGGTVPRSGPLLGS